MDFLKAIDEAFLRLFLLAIRILQALISIPIIGFVAAIINDFTNVDVRVPDKATAALAVACVCTVYTGLTFLPIFFGGPLFFTYCTVLDALFTAAWITLTTVWDCDGSNTCTAFEQKYFSGIHLPQGVTSSFQGDCKLTKAMFAFMIINL